MSFERFALGGRGFRPRVSIRKNGQIGFNNGAIKRFDMKKYKYAVLFFDKENRKIGILMTNDEAEQGVCKLQIREAKGSFSSSLSAKSFLDYFEVDYSKTTRYDVAYDEEGGMLIVDVSAQQP